MKDYVVADIKEFIEGEINNNNKYLIGACYLADDNEIYTEIKVSFRTNLVGNYKKLLAFLSTTNYILVKTDLCNYSTIIRAYK